MQYLIADFEFFGRFVCLCQSSNMLQTRELQSPSAPVESSICVYYTLNIFTLSRDQALERSKSILFFDTII